MRGIVKVFVVGTLGLAALFGSRAVSLAAPLKPPTDDPSSCTQTSVDTWLCVRDGKEYICPSPNSPQGCKYNPPPWGTPGRQQAPVLKPQAPGGMQIQTK